jgi:hypothetical protein
MPPSPPFGGAARLPLQPAHSGRASPRTGHSGTAQLRPTKDRFDGFLVCDPAPSGHQPEAAREKAGGLPVHMASRLPLFPRAYAVGMDALDGGILATAAKGPVSRRQIPD